MDRTASDQDTAAVEAIDAQEPSGANQENESSFMNRLLRGAAGFFRAGSDDEDAREDEADEAPPTESAEADKPLTVTEQELERRIQSEVDRREAKRAREREQADAQGRTQAEWQRLQALADEGDVWALGEIAKKEVEDRRRAEEESARFAETFARTAPTWDATYLDPLLAKLPEDVWKPIVGDGLTTIEDRQAAVEKALAAHREAAVSDALSDEKFVRDLLRSPSFRAAWFKADAVRKQWNAIQRGESDEIPVVAGVDRGSLPGNENEDMNALIRARAQAAVTGRSARRRERGNRDTLE